MNRFSHYLLCGLLATTVFGTQAACVLIEEEPERTGWKTTEPPVDPPVDPPVELDAALDAFYVSGHLGNYSSCPEKGYDPSGSDIQAGAPREPGLEQGDCAEGFTCGPIYNCEEAQLTLQLSNEAMSPSVAREVTVKKIELLDEEGMVRAELPVRQIVEVTSQQPFDGQLDIGEEVQVRVDYEGPVNLSELLQDEDAPNRTYYYEARLRITVEAENAEEVVIETKAVQRIPDVAT